MIVNTDRPAAAEVDMDPAARETATEAPEVLSDSAARSKAHLFLTRGVVAIAWAAVFAAASHSLTTSVTVGAGVLLILYPLIDVVGSTIDARSQRGSARRLLLADAAVSTIAAIALGVAATGTVANVLAVFGVWAAISGAAQLVVALGRRAQLGNQWPMLIAGSFSIIAGVAYLVLSAGANPRLRLLVLYTATGGVEFVVQAWLLNRRRRRLASPATPMLRAS
jgi:uncharacterized membrane protein HdeD (DUF308 family)